MSDRTKPKVRYRRRVRNKSSRNGVRPRLIVVHSTESSNQAGLADLVGLGAWFDNPRSRASSHVGIDAEGNSARYVRDSEKAWTCSGYNSVSLNIEQIGRAAQGGWTDKEYRECARWIAYWCKIHGIPVRKGRVLRGRVIRAGVLRHSELGALGGGHSDPGGKYNLRKVMKYARQYRRRY